MCVWGETGRKWVGGRSTGRRDALRSYFFVLPSSRFCEFTVLRLYGSMFLVVFGFTVLRFRHFLFAVVSVFASFGFDRFGRLDGFLVFLPSQCFKFFCVFAVVAEFTVVFFCLFDVFHSFFTGFNVFALTGLCGSCF